MRSLSRNSSRASHSCRNKSVSRSFQSAVILRLESTKLKSSLVNLSARSFSVRSPPQFKAQAPFHEPMGQLHIHQCERPLRGAPFLQQRLVRLIVCPGRQVNGQGRPRPPLTISKQDQSCHGSQQLRRCRCPAALSIWFEEKGGLLWPHFDREPPPSG